MWGIKPHKDGVRGFFWEISNESQERKGCFLIATGRFWLEFGFVGLFQKSVHR